MDFLDDDYEIPPSDSNYMKFVVGENRFRILTSPLMGWLDFRDNKPLRFPWVKDDKNKGKPEKSIDPKKPVKHFWAMGVWNYEINRVQILEITQKTIQESIRTFMKDKDWGNPVGYDITVTKKGQDKQTEYSVVPKPHKPITEEQIQAFRETPMELPKLLKGENPFEITGIRTDMLLEIE